MSDENVPVPIALRIGLGVTDDERDRCIDIALDIVDPQIELEVGPVLGQRVDDLLESVREPHRP